MQPATLRLDLWDGLRARAQPVVLQIDEHLALIIKGLEGDFLLKIDAKDLRQQLLWPEATQRGARIISFTAKAPEAWQDAQLHLPKGSSSADFDAWAREHLPKHAGAHSWVDRAQQSWRGVAAAFALLVAVLAGMYTWGLPVAARGITAFVPQTIDESIGRNALAQIDGRWMTPSRLPLADQQRIRERFLQGVKKQHPTNAPQITLEFRASGIGPNAFALPGGFMVMTDELFKLVHDDEVVLGVLGHELGHITRRHGMRQLVQVGVMQGVLSIAFGDYGSLITTAPLILGSMAYSRDHEREADDESIQFMKAAGISPLVMVKFFQAARAYKPPRQDKNGNQLPPTAEPPAPTAESTPKTKKTPLGFSIISSHPLDEERMEKFRKAAGG